MGRQPGDQGVYRFVYLGQGSTGMTQQRELHGKAEPIGGATAAADKFLVRPGEGVVPR